MLDAIGCASIADLFQSIPAKLRLEGGAQVPAAASEQEVLAELEALAARNDDATRLPWFLGAGTYAHFVPSAVDALASRAEFYTAYTPYQAEISQGTLQAIFEWQTMISGLAGLDVANASMYDGASATAEAALMAMRATRRSRVAVASTLHPHYRQVLDTYLGGLEAEVMTIPRDADGRSAAVDACVDEQTACVILQQPNFLGAVEQLRPAAEAAHARGALLVVSVGEALSLGLLRGGGELGADIVCGEAQSFGVPMGFGGPHLGFLATRQAHVRQLPGRLVGQTVDARGKRGFVLTLSTREQHIRRERATSNICTNQGLCLLMATVYLALLGRRGLAALARHNLAKAEYAKARVAETPGLHLPLAAPTFNEFVVGVPDPAEDALARAREAGIVAGLDLAPYAPDLGPALLVCTTELARREDIDRLASCLAGRSR
jgi:glycine dehydrogenase subunit 1